MKGKGQKENRSCFHGMKEVDETAVDGIIVGNRFGVLGRWNIHDGIERN